MSLGSRGPVVVVGASLGGLRSAQALRREGYVGPITVIGDERHLPYNRPPLSKGISDLLGHEQVALPLRSDTADVDWVLGERVRSADLAARTLSTSRGDLAYRALIIATGVRPKRVSGSDRAGGCLSLRTLEDALELRERLTAGAEVVVCGSGFVGCEVAAAAIDQGCRVTVVSASPFPMESSLGALLGEELLRRHRDRGIDFRLGRRVVRAVGKGRVTAAELDDGIMLPCDVLVEAVGSEPNVEWLRGNGLDLSAGVLTDRGMRAVREDGAHMVDVFAVGDVARFPSDRYGAQAVAVEHWNIPGETARRAARVLKAELEGEDVEGILAEVFAPIPSFWSDQGDIHLLAYGLPSLADRVELLEGEVTGDFVAGYFRGGELVAVCGVGPRAAVMRYRARLSEVTT